MGAQMVKNPSAMQGNWVASMGQEDPLEELLATHSSLCLENPMDIETWQATVHKAAESWT